MTAIEFCNDFVQQLPADPSTENRPRAVRNACYSLVNPSPVSSPEILAYIPEVARLLEWPVEADGELVQVLAGNRVTGDMKPYAACYGGHQFGNWAGQLGDGRAITLGEVENTRGQRLDVQLKGAGPTPYARSADGRAVLRSSLRELVASEAMHHLGVPTTRALSLVTTGDTVLRDMFYDGHPRHEKGAVVCRVAPTFLRFGNYQIHASRGDLETLKILVDFTLRNFFPQVGTPSPEAYVRFFHDVCRRTAVLMAEWTRVGFVHGVMNTDNMSILGLTIDYGPFGFLDSFDPNWTPNTTDAAGRRYRFSNQPKVAHWNLVQLANALLPLVGDTVPFERGLELYLRTFGEQASAMMLKKLGISAQSESEDNALVESMYELFSRVEIDYTLFFRVLSGLAVESPASSADERFERIGACLYAPESLGVEGRGTLDAWLVRYLERLRGEPAAAEERRANMHSVNPLYIPRNYLLQLAIDKAEAGDATGLNELIDVLRRPYEEQPGRESYAAKRPDWARQRAGCSMLSCSS